ncbi:transposase, is4-like protein [Rhodopirellula maiorica SM1]|uniref:Transposase, is4-like protein n=1 Tax=Rhodopirellula maiorica SM1 TaxID=1265738 RepID=M5RJ07_9BACT|nr:transposase [Rhodopirellula maiorica]EMI19191.1 transposase, is4-like protein [Rhodopirellula maiorica SM1]
MEYSIFQDSVFQNFVAEAPIATVAQMIMRRLIEPEAVNQIFDDNAELQYERTQMFSTITSVMASVILGQNPSVYAAHKKHAEKLGASCTALYNKLQRIEPATSRGLVQHSYHRAVEIQKTLGGVERNDVAGYQTRILDGNHLGKTEHRIKETRDLVAGPLPGKSLAVLDPRFKAICDFVPIEDGYAQELSGLDQIIETLAAKQLWIADRNFCTLKFVYAIAAKSGCFVIRQHGKLKGTIKGKEKKIGKTETGVVYENQLILPEYEGEQMTVRRVVIQLNTPTRDGDTEMVILTNLPIEDADAVRVAELYRDRWKVETAFLHMTLHLNCEINALCYPAASLFCFAVSIVSFNALSVIKSIVARVHSREASESLSHFYLCDEIARDSRGLLIALPEPRWDEVTRMPLQKYCDELIRIAGSMKIKRYRKSVRGPKKPPPKKKGNKRTVHVSTQRLLEKRKES